MNKCVRCGRFFSFDDQDNRFDHEPSSHFGPEINDWTCGDCVRKERVAAEKSMAFVRFICDGGFLQ